MRYDRSMRLTLCAILLAACGGPGVDDLVGNSCIDDRDCRESCETGGDFPGGFCTVGCASDRDCPSDTICADVRGGVCMYPCDVSDDCRFLGRGYACRDRDDWAGVRVGVCIGG